MINTKQKRRYRLKNTVCKACCFWLGKVNNNQNFLCLKILNLGINRKCQTTTTQEMCGMFGMYSVFEFKRNKYSVGNVWCCRFCFNKS